MSRVIGLTLGLALLFSAGAAVAVDRIVLLELFTNTGCGYCAQQEPAIRSFIQSHPESLFAIAYHVSWPSSTDPFYRANPTENTARKTFYAVTGVPHIEMDGRFEPVYPYTVGRLETQYQECNNRACNFEIRLSGEYLPQAKGGTGTVDIEIIGHDSPYSEDVRVVMAVTESDLYFVAPNGLLWHHWVMRDMVPDANGTQVEFFEPWPDTVNLSLDFTISPSWDEENCEIVVLLQKFGGMGTVHQCAGIRPTDLALADLAHEPMIPGGPRVVLGQNFPNPCNPATTIPLTLTREAHVTLRVYDVEGRLVRNLVESTVPRGDHAVEWDGLDGAGRRAASGIYYYRLQTEGLMLTHKMVVIR